MKKYGQGCLRVWLLYVCIGVTYRDVLNWNKE